MIKILFYGINGTGLGHISRLLNIARSARQELSAYGLKSDFQFITTSEAPQVAWDFPVYKLPSKTVVANLDTSNKIFAANSRLFITNLVSQIRPDVLVMDTIPQGSFNEFIVLKDFCKKTVFINRHKNLKESLSNIHQSHMRLYDLILVPDEESAYKRYPMPPEKHAVFSGAIHGFNEAEAWSRDAVRQYFDVPQDSQVLYLSAGGGGDKQAEGELEALVDIITQKKQLFVLVGYGPLYRGKKIYRPNVVPLTDIDNRRFFKGIDLAICAAGYNTYNELLAAKVPTSFYSQAKGLDSQAERIMLGAEKGWHRHLLNLDPISIADELDILMTESCQQQIKHELNLLPCSNGSQRAAQAILGLTEEFTNYIL